MHTKRYLLTLAIVALVGLFVVPTSAASVASTPVVTFTEDRVYEGDSYLDTNYGIFEVELSMAPTDDVTLDFTFATSQATFNNTSLTFTPTNWDQPQEVFITAPVDGIIEGRQATPINWETTSADVNFDGNTGTFDIEISDSYGHNASFEDPLGNADTSWFLSGGGSAITNTQFARPGSGDTFMVFNGNGSIEFVRQDIQFSGSTGETFEVNFYQAAENIPSTVIGARVQFLNSGSVVGTEQCTDTFSGSFLWQERTCTLTAPGDFDEVRLYIGHNAASGRIGIEQATFSRTPLTTAEVATYNGFDTLVAALVDTGLVTSFDEDSDADLTVFAPTEPAFADLLSALGIDAATLLSSTDLLTRVLTYHVVSGTVSSFDLSPGLEVSPLFPQPFTVDAGPQGATGFVIEDGYGQTSGIDAVDIYTTNGVIHVIDTVILPPTITQLADANPDLEDLTAALVQENLDATFNDPLMDYTVFAPTDDVFPDPGSFPSNIADILAYHASETVYLSSDLSDGLDITMLDTNTVEVNVTGGVTVTDTQSNTYNVTGADIQALNGVIHTIDGVLMPPPPPPFEQP